MSWPSNILAESGLRRFQLLGGFLVLLIALVGYAGSGFLLDDTLHLARVISGHGLGGLTYSIEPDSLGIHLLTGSEPLKFEYFRPLTSLSMVIDYSLFGLCPFGFHLFNTLLHLLNVGLVFVLARRLAIAPQPAWVAAVVWGVSLPAGLAVGWISGRSEILAATFVLTAVFAIQRYGDSGARRWLVSASAALVLGVLAKESAAVGPVLIAVYLLAANGRQAAGLRPVAQGVLWGPVTAVLVLRSVFMGLPRIPEPYFQPVNSPAAVGTALLKTAIYFLGGLTGLPVIPLHEVELLRQHWLGPLLLVLLVGIGLVILFRLVTRPKGLFLVAWFVTALVPALFVMAFSFYLYLPLVGLCWLFGLAWQQKYIRIWLVWLLTVGFVGNVVLGVGLTRLGHYVTEAEAVLTEALQGGGVTDIIVLDAPFWSYSLPVTVHLHHPAVAFQTHFLNFSPRLIPGTPSAVTWTNDYQFVLTAPDGQFFAAPIERFFLFGHEPCPGRWRGRIFTVNCHGDEGRSPYPPALQVTLNRSAAGPGLVLLQFDGWRLRRLPLSGRAGQTAPAEPLYRVGPIIPPSVPAMIRPERSRWACLGTEPPGEQPR